MKTRDLTLVALLLTALSVLLFALHYAIFRDARLIFIYGLHALAFLPLEVLVVTLLIDRLLSAHEKRDRQHKMNMVIGAFYSAVGRSLLRLMASIAVDRETPARLAVEPDWSEEQLRQACVWARDRQFSLEPDLRTLGALRDLLGEQREFMVRLLENPMLLEHEAFSELLWAVFHLQEELSARHSLTDCPASDLAHLGRDCERAYAHVLRQWLGYMLHLHRSYPFLFSFEARANPLRQGARVEVL